MMNFLLHKINNQIQSSNQNKSFFQNNFKVVCKIGLCGLVVRVLGYKSGGPGSKLSLVSTTEELLDRKVTAPVQKTENTALGIRHADHVAPSNPQKLAIFSPTSGGC
jgi:hypothetical protein